MQGPNQQPNPTTPFDPDQFKQDVLNAVQQQLTSFAQNNLAPLAQQQQLPQPPYGQPLPPPMQQAPGYYQQQLPPYQQQLPQPQYQPPFQQAQPGQQFGVVPMQPQQPMTPFGQQPTMDQMVQAVMLLIQRQEQMFQQIQSMQANNVSNQNVVNAAVAPPYPYTGDRVDRYRWLMDYGLQCEKDGTPRPTVLHRHIAERKRELKELEWALSFSEWRTLWSEKYTGIFFLKY